MKTKRVKTFLSIITVMIVAWAIGSCSKSDSTPAADKTALSAEVTVAQTLMTSTMEGTAAGTYTVGSKAVLQAAITAAQAVVASTSVTQAQVTAATTQLTTAVTNYQAALIQEIDAADLIAYWKFNEGTGTTVADASGNSHVGTFTVGNIHAGGGPIPTWSADRNGVAAQSLHFTKGGHIEVPSNAGFSPTEITVALWVNLDSLNTADCTAFGGRCSNGIFADNYMIAQNSYSGYKFQTQEGKFPFFTVKTGANPDVYINRDSGQPLALKKWFHLAVTYTSGAMIFYIDGVPYGTYTDTGAFIALTDRFDFVIGQELPNAKVDPGTTWVIPHFEGFMDEIRIYKKVLTPTQITSIYNQEKP